MHEYEYEDAEQTQASFAHVRSQQKIECKMKQLVKLDKQC